MQTVLKLFEQDAYLKQADAQILAVEPGWVLLDRTVFYAEGGGQPGDTGTLTPPDGPARRVVDCQYSDDRQQIRHVLDGGTDGLEAGQTVALSLDWDRRYRHMRLHSALHLMCGLVDAPVTGGAIRTDSARLDFDLPDTGLDKAALGAQLADAVARDAPVAVRRITAEELRARPDLVRTADVAPPEDGGPVRLIEIDGFDLQPCGGTHVARTGEIGPVSIAKIEKKGKRNRRVKLILA